jgi:hypothetical protein
MKFFIGMLMSITFTNPTSVQADWRWANPKFKIKKIKPVCDSAQCRKAARIQARQTHKARVKYYHAKKLAEWKTWTRLHIPHCTWYGESGTGPEYSKIRYTMPNSTGSGAYGKFQFMASTYHNVAKYKDWSPLDQEIAARREYWARGTAPWTNCG